MPKIDLDALRRRAASLFDGFTAGQRAMLGLALVGLVAGGWLFTRWSSTTPYATLYANLSADDAAAVTQQLSAKGVDYQLANGGSTVQVPRDGLYQLRLDLSSSGLPSKGSPGYALLDKHGITTSEFRQRVDYQRALEGELANTIGAIDGVASVDVHLVIPKDDVFSGDDVKPSASVLIRERTGANIATEQVQAVVNLVASSVEGLTPDLVTVADAAGNVLAAPGTDIDDAGGGHTEQRVAFEQRLAESIKGMLLPMVGEGHAVVRVAATLDFDERSTTSETFGPAEKSLPTQSTKVEETFDGTGPAAPAGILGPDGAPISTADEGTYSKVSEEQSFAVSKVTESVSSAPGSVERLSVAVLLDRDATKVPAATVEQLVRVAAGLDTARGDLVSVTSAAFDTSNDDEAEKAEAAAGEAKRFDQLFAILRVAGMILVVLITLFLAYRSARTATVARMPLGLPGGTVGSLSGIAALGVPDPIALGVGRDALLAEASEITAGAVLEEVLVPTGPVLKRMSERADELIDNQPEDVANMLRGWLGERRTVSS